MMSEVSYAQSKKTVFEKMKNFWQKIFSYPANVTNEAAGVISETVVNTAKVTAKEIETVGKVTSGEFGQTKNLVTEPLVGGAETAKKVVEETVAIPVNAGKEDAKTQ